MPGYEELMAAKAARMSPEAQDAEGVFGRHAVLARELIDLRQKHGLTQVELSAKSGVSQADISRIERGTANPTANTLGKLSRALDAEMHILARSAGVA